MNLSAARIRRVVRVFAFAMAWRQAETLGIADGEFFGDWCSLRRLRRNSVFWVNSKAFAAQLNAALETLLATEPQRVAKSYEFQMYEKLKAKYEDHR